MLLRLGRIGLAALSVRNSISRPISAAFSFSLVALVGVLCILAGLAHRGARLIDDADPT
jgi:hypothetical protein